MKYWSLALGLAILTQITLLTVPSAFAQAPTSPPAAKPDEASAARQAIQWSHDRLSELDATIGALERNAAQRKTEARAKAEAALKELRETRDAYRVKAKEAAANARTWTDAKVAEARKSLDESWTSFQTKVDEYLDAVEADLETRKAILEAELEAREKTWQAWIDELRTEAGKLAAQQKADIEARIAALKARADEEKARIGRLREASREAWDTVKQSYADAQKLFSDTYASIRKSIDEAAKKDVKDVKKQ